MQYTPEEPTEKRRIGRKTQIAAAVFFTLLAVFTGLDEAASVLALAPRYAMEQWTCDGKVQDQQQWEQQRKLLDIANYLAPRNADVAADIGRMHEWKAQSYPVWKRDAHEARREAIANYRRAVKYRPTWALGWLNLAQSKVLNGEMDDEAVMALENAIHFGRWQAEVQNRLVWLNLAIWNSLPEHLKLLAKQQISDMIIKDGNLQYLIAVSVRFDWLNELDPLLETQSQRDVLNKIMELDARKRRRLFASLLGNTSC